MVYKKVTLNYIIGPRRFSKFNSLMVKIKETLNPFLSSSLFFKDQGRTLHLEGWSVLPVEPLVLPRSSVRERVKFWETLWLTDVGPSMILTMSLHSRSLDVSEVTEYWISIHSMIFSYTGPVIDCNPYYF